MYIDKYTSTKEIINNLYRDIGKTDSLNIGDIAYWIYECMELINHPMVYIPKAMGVNGDEDYDFESYRISLPADFHKLIAVSVDGVMAIPSQNSLHHFMDGECCDWQTGNYPEERFYDNFGNVFSPTALPINNTKVSSGVTFTISNHHITFNQKEGQACLAYYAFPIDKEGFPLIPDDVKYKRACTKYIQWKHDYILWRQDLLNNNVFLKSEEEKDWAIGACQNHLKMPDVNKMESIRRTMTKMIIRTEDFKNAFSTMNTQGYLNRF
jgi:hypothetical protein